MNSAKKWSVRVIISFALPFLLIWIFFSKLLTEISSGFYFAWLDVRMGVDEFVRTWQIYDGSEESADKVRDRT